MAELTPEDLDRLGYSINKTTNKLELNGRAIDSTTQSLRGLSGVAGSVTSAFRSVSQGASTFSTFSGLVKSSSKALGDFSSKFGLAGKALGGVIDGVGDGIGMVLEQYDTALRTFQTLSQSGLAGAEGIDELRKNMVKAGVPMEMFSAMLLKNSESLAGLTGSSDQSAKQFAQMMSTMKNGLDQPLRDLGFTADEIGETLVTFSNLQRRLGNMQNMDQNMLTKGAIKFGKELDAIAKLTGQTRTEQQKTLESAMREGRYLASQRKLQSQGKAGKQAAQEIDKLMLGMSKISPTMAQAVKDISGGFVNTEAAKQAFVTTGGEITRVMADMRSGNMGYGNAMEALQGSIKQTMPTMESIALAVGDTTGSFIPLYESANLLTFALGDLDKAIDQNKKTQQAQISADKDATTKELVNAQKYLLSSASHLQATAISFDKVSGGLELVMAGIDSVSKGTYNRIGTISDKETPNVLQTQTDIDINADKQQVKIATDRKVKLENLIKYQQGDSAERQAMIAELADLNSKLPILTASLNTNIETRRKNQLKNGNTLGRLFKQFLPERSIMGDKNSTFGTSDFSSQDALKDILEKRSGLNASRVLSEQQLGKIRDTWNKNPDLDSKKLWENLKPIFDKMQENDEKKNSDNIQSNANVVKDESMSTAMNDLFNANTEANKKLDSIVTALNQGNRNTQSIKQATQMG